MQSQAVNNAHRASFVQRGRVLAARGQHINVRNPADIARWSRELGVTWMQLLTLIDRVGSSVRSIRHAILNGSAVTH